MPPGRTRRTPSATGSTPTAATTPSTTATTARGGSTTASRRSRTTPSTTGTDGDNAGLSALAVAAAGAATPSPASGGSMEESDAACAELLHLYDNMGGWWPGQVDSEAPLLLDPRVHTHNNTHNAQAAREKKKPKGEQSEIAAALEVSSATITGALKELVAARITKAEVNKANVVGMWYMKLLNGEVQWAGLPAAIKALFDNKKPLD
eukprot:evm.model.NODE_44607_length_15938_cov_30.054523.5